MATHPLTALMVRARKPIYTTPDDVAIATAALLDLAPFLSAAETRLAVLPLRKFAHHNPALLMSALTETPADPAAPLDGKRVALLTRAIPVAKSDTATQLWSQVASTTTAALAAKAWSAAELKTIIAHLRRNATYTATLVDAVVAYVGAVLPSAAAGDLPTLISLITALPEVTSHSANLLHAAAERCAACGDALSPGAIGHICGQLNRALCTSASAAVAFQEEADRCAEKGDPFTAVQLFAFIARHKAEHITTEALTWLMERLTGEELDVPSVELLCSSVVRLPLTTRVALQQELTDFIGYLATQAKELVSTVSVAQGGLHGCNDVETVQVFVSHVLELAVVLKSFTGQPMPPEYLEAANACAAAVAPLAENMLAAESSPFGLMVRLLESPAPQCKELGAALLREASSQCISFPTLQVFRFLLAMGDQQIHDAATAQYLRDQFAKTAADVPPAHMSAALRCLVIATRSADGAPSPASTEAGDDDEVDDDAECERERLRNFLQFCVEKTQKHLSEGAPLRCILSTTESLHRLGCRDSAFYSNVAAYTELKRDAAAVGELSADSAAAVRAALGASLLEQFPEVHEFLLDVEERGVKGESAMPPSQWLYLHDPASTLEPLTPQQQESWDIVEEMVRTRADDTAALKRLAERYVELLPHTRPDDHKYFFGVFEDKVMKEDKLLKQCLDAIVDSGKLSRMSAPTIAGMLQSLAAVRFQYFPSIKRFMLSITAEQWMSMEAAPLVQILVGMEKLSLRTPAVLRHIGGRLDELCRFLTPLDTALALHAFKALRYHNPQLTAKLVSHAAAMARRFDERSINVLFTTPSIHRLLATPAEARPLLLQASAKINSAHQREKIANWVVKSALPRELISSTAARLQLANRSGPAGSDVPLRLT